MIIGWNRALRFGKGWKIGAQGLREQEVEVSTPLGPVPATLLTPGGGGSPLPGWVTLHGITRPGRKHPTLIRFVRALASSGAAVLVPEVAQWTELHLAPLEAGQILKASILTLAHRPETAPGRLGAMGFSFGAPSVLMAGADPELAPHLRAVTCFGGYGDLERTAHFLFRGEHEWRGEHHSLDPDPYGRWVVAGNLLTRIPGFEDYGDVARALLKMAQIAGDTQIPSWDGHMVTVGAELEAKVDPARRQLFRELGIAFGTRSPEGRTREIVPLLARAAVSSSPLYDVLSNLQGIRVPVRLIHGRGDRLIPFTETLRVAEAVPDETEKRVYLTGLFSHSRRDNQGDFLGDLGEMSRFLHMMSDILGLV